LSEDEREDCDEEEDDELDYRFEGLDYLIDVDYLKREEEQKVEDCQRQEEIENRFYFYFEALFLLFAQVVPDHLVGRRTWLAVDFSLL